MSIDTAPDFEMIPVFDMQKFLIHGTTERNHFIAGLRDVCHNVVFFTFIIMAVTYIQFHFSWNPILRQRFLLLLSK